MLRVPIRSLRWWGQGTSDCQKKNREDKAGIVVNGLFKPQDTIHLQDSSEERPGRERNPDWGSQGRPQHPLMAVPQRLGEPGLHRTPGGPLHCRPEPKRCPPHAGLQQASFCQLAPLLPALWNYPEKSQPPGLALCLQTPLNSPLFRPDAWVHFRVPCTVQTVCHLAALTWTPQCVGKAP